MLLRRAEDNVASPLHVDKIAFYSSTIVDTVCILRMVSLFQSSWAWLWLRRSGALQSLRVTDFEQIIVPGHFESPREFRRQN
jgi:hypothetical protein